jgi:hypothetical protein
MNFPLEKGLAIQQEQLLKWQKVLKPEAFERLLKYCNKVNSELPTDSKGFNVFRGTDLDMFVQNNLMLENGFYKED